MEFERYNLNFKKLGRAIKKEEKAVSHDIHELEKVVVDVAKDAVKILKNAGEDVAFAPLLLLKPAMKEEIAKAGLTDDGTILDITGKFVKAKMDEVKKGHHFDRFSATDSFGFPEAPGYIKVPVHLGASAAGVPTSIPGLPDPADVVWGFFHKEHNKPGSTTNAIVSQAKADGYGKDKSAKGKLSAFLKDPKKLAITIGIIAAIVIAIVFLTSSKK